MKPDVVLRKHKIAVFVHGCFWHQHEGCKLAYSDRKYSD
ncbi:MAG: very short patch repair endonuclease, partial [Methylococcales bacterium]